MDNDSNQAAELARHLIQAMGTDEARDIARRNCWDGILEQIRSLENQPQPE